MVAMMPDFPLTLILTSLPFMISMAFTPGPNNIMVASSGVNFGFRATVPHMLGVTLGFPVMLLIVGLGLARIFITLPGVHVALKYVSIVYLLYLAWRIATATSLQSARVTARPISFWQAAAFQWVNVKAVIIALSTVTTYTVVNATLPAQICALAALSTGITLASVCTWTLFGHFLRSYLHTPERRRVFNYSMAALLVASIVPLFWE